jgi:predicted DNA-binding protein
MSEMSLRAYARHRGCSLAAVQKAIFYARIPVLRREQHGAKEFVFVDSDVCDASWLGNTDSRQQRVPTRAEQGKGPQTRVKEPVPQHVDDADDPTLPAPKEKKPPRPVDAMSRENKVYLQHRTQKEKFDALQAELDYRKDAGELVPAEKVKIAWANMAQQVQQNLMNLSARFSSQIAAAYKTAITDLINQIEDGKVATKNDLLKWIDCLIEEKTVADIVNGEINKTLTELANAKHC